MTDLTKAEARCILWMIDASGGANGWGTKGRYAAACKLAKRALDALEAKSKKTSEPGGAAPGAKGGTT